MDDLFMEIKIEKGALVVEVVEFTDTGDRPVMKASISLADLKAALDEIGPTIKSTED